LWHLRQTCATITFSALVSVVVFAPAVVLLLVLAIQAAEPLPVAPQPTPRKPFKQFDFWIKQCEELEATLKYSQGKNVLMDGAVTLDLSPEFRFLDVEQAKQVLQMLVFCGHDDFVADDNAEFLLGFRCNVGMICRSDVSPMSEQRCNVIIYLNGRGHMSDEGAGQLDFDSVLQEKQQRTSKFDLLTFEFTGLPPHIIGWAKLPRCDQANHSVSWGDERKISKSGEQELWYHACLLGRSGALEMTAVAPMSRLADIEATVEKVMPCAKFNQGFRYDDYSPRTDKPAQYGMDVILLGAESSQARWGSWLSMAVYAALSGIGVLATKLLNKRFRGTWLTRPISDTLFGSSDSGLPSSSYIEPKWETSDIEPGEAEEGAKPSPDE